GEYLMLNKLFKFNRKENVNIWVRKSMVKFGKRKSLIIEVFTPEQHFFIFKDRKYFKEILLNPLNLIDQFTDSQKVKELINKDGFFYFNGEKIVLKELLQ